MARSPRSWARERNRQSTGSQGREARAVLGRENRPWRMAGCGWGGTMKMRLGCRAMPCCATQTGKGVQRAIASATGPTVPSCRVDTRMNAISGRGSTGQWVKKISSAACPPSQAANATMGRPGRDGGGPFVVIRQLYPGWPGPGAGPTYVLLLKNSIICLQIHCHP